MRILLACLALSLLATPLMAEDTVVDAQVGDTSAINWVYPGHFKEALKQAEETPRLMLIKCVFFGVDEEGATCATKGLW